MERGICKLCGVDAELCESHIIPEFLYKPLYNEKHFVNKLHVNRRVPGKLQKGYREPLLCADCEQLLNECYEKPFLKLWRHGDLLPKAIRPRQVHVSQDLNYTNTKLFLLSVLWRANVARHPTWGLVELGPHSERIRQMLINGDPGQPEDYPIAGYLAVENNEIAQMIGSPICWRLDSRRLYSILFGGIEWSYLVGSHRLMLAESVSLRPEGPHRFLACALQDLRTISGMKDHWRKARHPAEGPVRVRKRRPASDRVSGPPR